MHAIQHNHLNNCLSGYFLLIDRRFFTKHRAVIIAAFAESSWSLIWARMKDRNVEDTRNLLPVDDAANECVPREQRERLDNAVFQFSPCPSSLRSSNRAALFVRPLWFTYYFVLSFSLSLSLSRPLSSATRTIIKHVDSRPVVNLALFYPYPPPRFKRIL